MNPRTRFSSHAALLAVLLSPLTGQTFAVNTTADTPDANPGDGICADANGRCSLRAAIMEVNAASSASATIRLQPGRYYALARVGAGEDAAATGDLDVLRNVRIVGRGAIVDGLRADRAIDVMAGANVIVTDLTLLSGAVVDGNGGAVRNAGRLVLDQVRIANSAATGTGASGGAVMNAGGDLVITHCELIGNRSDRAGGAIEANGGITALVASSFYANRTGAAPGNGGAFHLTGAGMVHVSECEFAGNVAAREGGALWNSSGGVMTVDRSWIYDNDADGSAADDGGGGLFNDGGELTVTSSFIEGNAAIVGAGSGGGLFNNDGILVVRDCEIAANSCNRAGGGVEALGGMTSIETSKIIWNDTGASPGNGGGLHLTGAGAVHVLDCTVSANFAAAEGGGLWNSGNGTMSVTDCVLEGNRASGAAADQGGGALFNAGGDLDVADCLIQFNVADGVAGSGGAVLNDDGVLTMSRCTVLANWSQRAGGGVEANVGATSLITTYLLFNETGSSPGNGGGLHLTGAGNVALQNCLVLLNSASNEGGGLWNSATGVMHATFTFVLANDAPIGPDVFNDGGTFTLNGNPVP